MFPYEVLQSTGRLPNRERGFFIDNLLVRVHFIIVMIRWTGLGPWEFQSPFPGTLTSTFLAHPTPNPNPAPQALACVLMAVGVLLLLVVSHWSESTLSS